MIADAPLGQVVSLPTDPLAEVTAPSGTSGGMHDLSTSMPPCKGWIQARPDHELVVSAPVPWLRIFAEADEPTVLVIESPGGEIWCNDHRYGRHPAIERAFSTGRYRIWVGSFAQGGNATYKLTITRKPQVVPAVTAAEPTNRAVLPAMTADEIQAVRDRYGSRPRVPAGQGHAVGRYKVYMFSKCEGSESFWLYQGGPLSGLDAPHQGSVGPFTSHTLRTFEGEAPVTFCVLDYRTRRVRSCNTVTSGEVSLLIPGSCSGFVQVSSPAQLR